TVKFVLLRAVLLVVAYPLREDREQAARLLRCKSDGVILKFYGFQLTLENIARHRRAGFDAHGRVDRIERIAYTRAAQRECLLVSNTGRIPARVFEPRRL